MAGGHSDDTFHHVRDFPYFELPFGVKLKLPAVHDVIPSADGHWWDFQLTKYMVLQVAAAVIVFVIFRGLVKRVNSSGPVRGRWWNFWEMLAVFVRDEIVRPTIGTGDHGHDDHGDHSAEAKAHHAAEESGHPADKYLPFIWSCFFYVLICNLLGAFPWMGSPNAEINVTGVLAVVTLGVVITAGVKQSGPVGFWMSLAPSMDMNIGLKAVLVPVIWVIELIGFLIKHGVLAVRLFANIMAGHTVIAVILGFIAMHMHHGLFYAVMPASILGQVAIGMLELFVSFLQAYIFAFLATLFLSAAVNPH